MSLAGLADEDVLDTGSSATAIAIDRLVSNPRNPRASLGDLSELTASLKANGQLQALTVVTRSAYGAARPGDAAAVADADYVVIMGNRRLAAAHAAGLKRLDVLVKDTLAGQAETLAAAPVVENIERRDFDPMEEAHAVADLVEAFSSTGKRKQDVATHLGRSGGWVTQRLALLKLAPLLQQKVQSGEVPVRLAREWAKLSEAEQLEAWEQHLAGEAFFTAVKNPEPDEETPDAIEAVEKPAAAPYSYSRMVSGIYRSIRRDGLTATEFADGFAAELTTRLDHDYLIALRDHLDKLTRPNTG